MNSWKKSKNRLITITTGTKKRKEKRTGGKLKCKKRKKSTAYFTTCINFASYANEKNKRKHRQHRLLAFHPVSVQT